MGVKSSVSKSKPTIDTHSCAGHGVGVEERETGDMCPSPS